MGKEKRQKIGVIFGGLSSEKEISLATGRYVFSLLDPSKFEGIPLFMDSKGNLWLITPKLVLQNTTADIEEKLRFEAERVSFEKLNSLVNLVFIALLGKYGEDGCIQGILELLRIPYTGSGILASAVGMDKKIHKKVLQQAGFRVPGSLVVEKEEWEKKAKGKRQKAKVIGEEIGFPCIIKPTREGSSIGVTLVRGEEDLDKAFASAFEWDREALVEEYIQGLEWMCVVWGNENPQAMLPTEVEFEGDIFTYEGKYLPGKARMITPARVDKKVLDAIQRAAVGVYKLIGIKGYGRVDGYVVDEEIIIGEPHTGTIMVPSSYVFQQAAKFNLEVKSEFSGKKIQAGMSPRMFVSEVIREAFEAHKTKKQML